MMPRVHISSGSRFEEEIGYSRAVVDGDYAWVSGTTGYDYKAMTIAEDVVAQATQCFENIAAALAHGLRHYRDGRVAEALWWWQFSYVASWGAEASAVLRAVQSVIAHDRLDSDFESERDDVALAAQMLDTGDPAP